MTVESFGRPQRFSNLLNPQSRYYWPIVLRRRLKVATLWYRRLQTDKDPRYAVANLKKLQEEYEQLNAAERTEASQWITKIVSHLVMPNGTIKMSRAGRHTEAIEILLKEFKSELPSSVKVLELGSSIGVDAIGMREQLRQSFEIQQYLMTDLYTRLLFDEEHQLAYDEHGELVQAFVSQRYVSIHVTDFFRWTAWLMKLVNMPYVRRARRLAARAGDSSTVEVILLHPEAARLVREGELKYEQQDVLEPFPGQHNLVIAFNILDKCYFSDAQLRVAIRNVRNSLSDGGLLIVGTENNDFSVFAKSEGKLVMEYKRGWGSGCDEVIAEESQGHQRTLLTAL